MSYTMKNQRFVLMFYNGSLTDLDVFDPLFELFVTHDALRFSPCLVGVDRMDGVVQELGNPFAIGDSKSDQSEDSHLGSKLGSIRIDHSFREK